MGARNGGVHHGGEKQRGGPNREEESDTEGRFPPTNAKHANKRVQTGDVQQRTKRMKQVDPSMVGPVCLQHTVES